MSSVHPTLQRESGGGIAETSLWKSGGDDEWRCKRNESSLVRARSETRGKEGFGRGKRKIMLRQEAAPKTVTVMATPVTVRQIVRHRYSDRAQPSNSKANWSRKVFDDELEAPPL